MWAYRPQLFLPLFPSFSQHPTCLDGLGGQRGPGDGDGQAAGKGAAHVRHGCRAAQQRGQIELKVVQREHIAAAERHLQRATAGRRGDGG